MSAPTVPELSVVIPTWNGWELLEACLQSLARQTHQDMEIIVVDDGSTDDTPARLAEAYPHVKCVVSPVNRGFAPTANQGLVMARAPWVFLLNNDVTLEAQCIEKLLACAREGRYGMICPLVLWTEDPQLIYSAGDRIGVNGRPVSLAYKCSREAVTEFAPPFGISGGYGLFRRDMLEAIGLLDNTFVAYFEDADWCFRARWAGHEAALVPDAVAFHVGSASIQGRIWWRTRQCFQNHALLVWKNFTWRLLWRNRRALLKERCHQWARLFSVARNEWGAAAALVVTLSAWGGLMRRMPAAIRARRALGARRTLGDDAMQALLERGDDIRGL